MVHTRHLSAMFDLVPKHLLSRLLYSNPVCFLCTNDVQTLRASTNIMTVSWITPIDNKGTFVMSLNNSRHTVSNLFPESFPRGVSSKFTLSLAVRGHEDVLKRIGSMSGKDATNRGKKAELAGLQLSKLFIPTPAGKGKKRARATETTTVIEEEEGEEGWEVECVMGEIGKSQCPAHLACVVERILASDPKVERSSGDGGRVEYDAIQDTSTTTFGGHLLLQCRIVFGRVDPQYFLDGKCLAPPLSSPGLLSFLGSGNFAEMRPLAE